MGAAAGTFHYTYGDHLGSIVALSNATGGYLANSLARYDPFGNYRTEPAATVNPGQTNHGYTGHRHNNTGAYATQDVGLIYMNARYYLPEVGRFISPDTIVPDPSNPQSYNRYSYVRNSPLNSTDPTGHREMGTDENEVLPREVPVPAPVPPPTPTLSNMLSPIEPIFEGLPVEGVQWAHGFGANAFAKKYGDPSSALYDPQRPKYHNSAGLHGGIDLGVDAGTEVYANVYGKLVVPSPYKGDAGPNVIVQLANGMMVVYGHVDRAEGLVDGMDVSPGMLIGTVNDQGTGSHVHLGLREGQRAYNPAYFFKDSSVVGALPYSDYVEGENLYSISSFLYQPVADVSNYWHDGALSVGVWR